MYVDKQQCYRKIYRSSTILFLSMAVYFYAKSLTMKITKLVLVFAVLGLTTEALAQKVRLTDGKIDALKGVTKMNVQFDYSSMGVGKFADEADYIDKKKSEYNRTEPGRGETWEKSWKADRKNRFQPQFIELFTKHSDINLGDYPNEKYTLIFKTTYTEPGYNVVVSSKNAEVDGEAWVVETANPNSVVAKISVQNCPGRTFGGNDYDTGERIQESYAVAGKGLGKFLRKELK